jgi:very-short-patch-repair endonuclease
MEKGGCFFLFLKGLQIENSTLRYQILPQYSVSLADKQFRLDFAILIEEKINEQFILRKKYCIECDGHDYHSSRSQIAGDNQRMRLLTNDGWIVLRYSGSEIYNINQSSIMDLDEILNKLDRLN